MALAGLVRRRPAETAAGSLGVLLAVLTTVFDWSPKTAGLFLVIAGAVPAVVTWVKVNTGLLG